MSMMMNVFQSILSYAVYIPGMIMVVTPSLPFSRYSEKVTWILACSYTTCLCIFCGAAEALTGCSIPDVPLILGCLALYLAAFDLSRLKLIYLFFTVTAFLSFGSFFYELVASILNPYGMGKFSLPAFLTQYAINFLLLFIFWKIRFRMTWILRQKSYDKLWYTVWIIPMIVGFCNLLVRPKDYKTMHYGNVFSYTVIIMVELFILFSLYQILLYYNTYDIVKSIQSENNLSILENQINVQNRRGEEFRKNQEILRIQRHDLRHQYRILTGFLNKGETEKAKEYLGELQDAIPVDEWPEYCDNSAASAICAFYATQAEEKGIDVSILIDIPEKTEGISDSHLCIVFGNLLENAIHACEKMPEGEKRYIKLRARIEQGTLYITMENSMACSAPIKSAKYDMDNVLEGEHGVGLLSVMSVADVHGGSAYFIPKKGEFSSAVWMQTGKK